MVFTENNITGLVFPEIKTDRALELLKTLESLIERWKGERFYRIRAFDDIPNRKHIKIIEFAALPNEIPLTLGESLYDLRSALDQVAWQLSLLTAKRPSRKTQFPIQLKPNKDTFERQTHDIPSAAKDVIESLQPYHSADPEHHPLWLLSELCNLDKHAVPALRYSEYAVRVENAHHQETEEHYTVRLLFDIADKFVARVTVTLNDFALGAPMDTLEERVEAPFSALREIHAFVNEKVLPQFKQFF